MATRREVQDLLDAGLDYEAAGQRLGIPAGQAYLIATGRPADGSAEPATKDDDGGPDGGADPPPAGPPRRTTTRRPARRCGTGWPAGPGTTPRCRRRPGTTRTRPRNPGSP